MATLSPSQVYALAQQHFGDLGASVVQTMAAIAMGESGGNPGALNNTAYPDRPGYRPPAAGALPEYSGGLWQVNTGPGGNTDMAGLDLSDPHQNAQAARAILDRQGLGAWSVYTNRSYEQYLPQMQQLAGTYQKTGSASVRASQQPEAIAMNDVAQMLWGYYLPYLAEQVNGPAANRDITLQTLAGYLNPNALGFNTSGGVPTLAREMWEKESGEADRQYALDVARHGVAVAMANYTQRMGAASVKLEELGLMSSLRGPSNAIAYNYALNNLAVPPGTEVNPHATSGGIYQPISDQIPGMGAMGGQQQPRQQQPPPTAPRTWDVGVASPVDPGSVGADQYAHAHQQSQQLAQQGQATAIGTEGGLWEMKDGKWHETAPVGSFAQGGVLEGGAPPIVMTGDSESGAPTGNEELVVNPTGAPIGVVPNEAIPDDLQTAPAGEMDTDEVLRLIAQLIDTALVEKEAQPEAAPVPAPVPAGAVPRANAGGAFSNTVYSPEEIAGMPVLQKIAGQMDPRQFGSTGLNTTVPGTDFALPQGHRANVRTLMSLRPSEMDTLGSVIETPREMGGLGMHFGDWLHDAAQAAPMGRSFGPSAYLG